MGKCSICGKTGSFLHPLATAQCASCRKEGCGECLRIGFVMAASDQDHVARQDEVRFCSETCWGKFLEELQHAKANVNSYRVCKVNSKSLTSSDQLDLIVGNALNGMNPDILKKLTKELDGSIAFHADMPADMRSAFHREQTLIAAEILEKAGRFEEAAQEYESVGMFEEAGRVRKQDRVIVVKQTQVSVDLNTLLQQVKDGGMVVVYRCPNCGGNIKISGDTPANGLNTCQYCNTPLKTLDLMEYLKSALS